MARTVNADLVVLYSEIGSRIRRDILGTGRAEYGNQIVSTLSRQLAAEYGAGFSRQNLFHMIRFVEAWPERAQVTTLAQKSRQFGRRPASAEFAVPGLSLCEGVTYNAEYQAVLVAINTGG